MPDLMGIDVETYSSAPLPKCGVYRYCDAPDFEILLFSYAFDDEPVQTIDLASGETLPKEAISALEDPDIIKVAYNAQFERVCLSRYLGHWLDPHQWRCTMVMAAYLTLPGRLADAAVALGTTEKKMEEGKDLMGSVKIMKLLTEEGVPAPLGGLWNASVVMEMLKNEKYVGDLLLQKFYTNNHVEKKRFHNRGELPQYFVGEDHEPIIDRETFDAVQREIAWRTAQRKAAKAKRTATNAELSASAVEPSMSSSGNNSRETIPLTDRIYCGVCGKRYRYKVTRLGTPYAAPVWICSTFNYRGKAYCASKQIPEDILKELIASALGTVYTEDSVHHIEMHPGNRVLFVFQDGHTEEHFWEDHSRKDSWNEEKRQKAAEKTRIQHQKRKEQEQ